MSDDLHPQMRALLTKMDELGLPKTHTLTPEAARSLMETLAKARQAEYPPPEVEEVEDTVTGPDHGNVTVRIYRTSHDDKAPAIVFFHGGGHVIGTRNSY
ncbi:MAG: alpha/beta hydrolase, partial [Pseudomonadota bacterium]